MYRLTLRMELQETTDTGQYMSNAFAMTDSIDMGHMPFGQLLDIMRDLHSVYSNMKPKNG